MGTNEAGGRFAVVLTTAGSEEVAARLAEALVSRRLAACVNVVPGIVSTYRWEGKVETDPERLLVIKTTAERLAEGNKSHGTRLRPSGQIRSQSAGWPPQLCSRSHRGPVTSSGN